MRWPERTGKVDPATLSKAETADLIASMMEIVANHKAATKEEIESSWATGSAPGRQFGRAFVRFDTPQGVRTAEVERGGETLELVGGETVTAADAIAITAEEFRRSKMDDMELYELECWEAD